MATRGVAAAVLALTFAAVPAFGQSLAEVARTEEARRAAAPKTKKTYTNADLNPGATPEAVAADEGFTPTEDPIRKQAESIRGELARAQKEVDDLVAQSENAALSEANRNLAAEQLVLTAPSLAGAQRRWVQLERQIKDHKLPHAWIEPVPSNALPPQ